MGFTPQGALIVMGRFATHFLRMNSPSPHQSEPASPVSRIAPWDALRRFPRHILLTLGLVFSLTALTASVSFAGPMDVGGQLSVSENGAAIYSIPLQVAPGIAGIEPKLALSYSSQTGNGLLGVGWSLSGLSAVTRCPRTLAQDGARGGINFDAKDRFCLDGQRLIVVSGTYGAAGSEYRTERDSFNKIVANGAAGTAPTNSNPSSFTVWTKSGQIIEYGNTVDSRIEAQGRSDGSVRVWAIDKISDTKNNYLTFSYNEDTTNGDYTPTRIDYTGNGSNPTSASVQFVYETRPDIVPLYFAGSLVQSVKRLTTIQSCLATSSQACSAGTQIREYRLTYGTSASSLRSRIATLSECAMPSSSCKASVSLTWTEFGSNSFQTSSQWSNQFAKNQVTAEGYYWGDQITGSNRRVSVADFNGDGKADILGQASITYGCVFPCVGTKAELGYASISNGNSFASPTLVYTAGLSAPNSPALSYTSVVSLGFELPGDFNGDGYLDWVRTTQPDGTAGTAINLGNSSGMAQTAIWTTTNQTGCYSFICSALDINGDGKADLISIWTDGTYVTLSTGSTFGTATRLTTALNTNTSSSYPSQYMDINGDGLPDLVGFTPSGVQVALNNGTFAADAGFDAATTWIADFGTNAGNWTGTVVQGVNTGDSTWPRMFADVNGDGLPDIVGFKDDGVYVSLNTGTGFLPATKWTTEFGTNTNWSDQGTYPRIVMDVNGDGKADIVGFGIAGVYVALSTGTGFSTSSQWVAGFGTNAGWTNFSDYPRQLADVDGDGFPDIVGFGNSGVYVSTSGKTTAPDRVNAINLGIGGAVNITYSPLTNSAVYTKGSGSTYPTVDLQVPLYVVSQVQSPNGIGTGYTTTNYQYGSLKSDLAGHGPLGFGSMQVTQVDPNNSSNNITTNTTYRQDWPYVGLPSQVKKTMPSASGPGNQLDLVTYTYNCSDFTVGTNCTAGTSKHYFPYLKTSVEDSWDTNGTALPEVTTTNTFDCEGTPTGCYGNVTSVSVSTGDGYSKTTTNTYKTADTTNWILGRLVRSTVQSTVPDASIPSAPTAPAAAPTLTGISPTSGSAAGGTTITLSGTNFATGATVTLGGTAATGCTVVSSTTITCTTPAMSAGAKDVMVIVAGTSAALAGGFTSMAVPTLTSISPNIGALAGGTGVTLTGTNFTTGATVTIGGTAATGCSVVNSTTITCTTPAGTAGATNVVVTETGGTATLSNGYTYQTVPSLASISPTVGPLAGGTAVTLNGTGFGSGASVTIGGTAATGCTVVSGTTITCTTPSGTAGAKNVVVTQPGGSSTLTNGYTYQAAPSLTSISPTSGTTAGGTAVTLTGTSFATGATVTIGGASATGCTVVSSTSITCTTPSGTAGAQNVVITQPGGTSTLSGGYTYVIPNFTFNATISANTTNYNLRAAAVTAGWNQTVPLVATVTINSGVIVGSTSTGTAAFATGSSFPSGSTLAIVNNGSILGMGGAAGKGGGTGGVNGTAGSAGGLALTLSYAISITNNGTIGGGGGGAGGGAGYTMMSLYSGGGGGGGGRGSAGGSGGAAGTGVINGGAGASGSSSAAGTGGAACGSGCGTGGTGGTLGATGGNGGNGNFGSTGGSGGAAGACTSGNSYITWSVVGTRYGALN